MNRLADQSVPGPFDIVTKGLAQMVNWKKETELQYFRLGLGFWYNKVQISRKKIVCRYDILRLRSTGFDANEVTGTIQCFYTISVFTNCVENS